jgi:ribosome maturation factor RimP
MTDQLYASLLPLVAAADLELIDVELRSGVLLVTVDRPGGVDLEALTDANRAVSAALDEIDPIPGRYTLEVSSPGVERTLRTPAHFTKAVGELVTIKTRPQVPGDRRVRGTLLSADDAGIELEIEQATDGRLALAYSDIDRARTVFVWGPDPRPGRAGANANGAKKTATPKTAEKKKRKQVVTP